MYDYLSCKMKAQGYEMRLISIECLNNLKDEIDDLYESYTLESGISGFLKGFYDFRKPTEFDVKSIMIVASPSPVVNVYFWYHGIKHSVTLPPTYQEFISKPKEVELTLNQLLSSYNYHVLRAPGLPEKLLAAHSGLSSYGRNNITYAPDMGSFMLLMAYFSDMPCEKRGWQEIQTLSSCEKCTLCMEACPTGAISPDRKLIYADRCITYQNEFITEDSFPEWMDQGVHNSLIGCMKCQMVCPQNQRYLNNIVKVDEFNEEETYLILKKESLDSLPKSLKTRLNDLNLAVYYQVLARNLKVLLEK